jgi:hypothetical protein
LDVFQSCHTVFHFLPRGHAPEADDAIPELTGWVRPKLDFPENVFV